MALRKESPPSLYSSSINGWRPTQMLDLLELCKALDVDESTGKRRYVEPDYLEILRENNKIPQHVVGYEELTKRQRVQYADAVADHEAAYRKRWRAMLDATVRYKRP